MKTLRFSSVLFFLFAFVFATQVLANDPSTQDQDYQVRMSEQRVNDLVKSVQQWRNDLNVGREVAGRTSEDERWAQEWNNLMDDGSDKDYLKMSAEL